MLKLCYVIVEVMLEDVIVEVMLEDVIVEVMLDDVIARIVMLEDVIVEVMLEDVIFEVKDNEIGEQVLQTMTKLYARVRAFSHAKKVTYIKTEITQKGPEKTTY